MSDSTTPAPGDPLGLVPQLVALASDITDTRSRLDQVTTAVEALDDQVTAAVESLGERVNAAAGDASAAAEQLDAVHNALGDLAAAVERLSADPPRSPLWVWVDMDTPARREALRELAEWVDDVLVSRYQLDNRDLPRCWYRHPAAIEELTWLYLDWTRVYRGGPGTSTSAAGEWHDRWRPGALDRISRSLSGCRTAHREQIAQPPPGVDPGFDSYLAELDQPTAPAPNRPGTPPGPPSAGQPWRSD